MDLTWYESQGSIAISRALAAVLEAAQHTREAKRLELASDLENLAEELIYSRRKLLNLPPQKSTALASEEDEVPF